MTCVNSPLWVPEREYNEGKANRDLNQIGDPPGDVVRLLMECHPIASPESDERPQLITKLRDRSYEAASKLAWCTFSDIEVRCDVYTAKAQTCEETTKEENSVCIWHYLYNTVMSSVDVTCGEKCYGK